MRDARRGDPAAHGPGRARWSSAPGPTGLLLAQLIARGGASSVTVAAPSAFKLETAKTLGIDRTVQLDRRDPDGNLRRLREQSPGGDGFDIVVEATGSTGDRRHLRAPDPQRRNRAGLRRHPGARTSSTFHPFDVFRREITIKGSFAEITSFGAAIAALRTGRARTDGHHHSPLRPRRLRQGPRRPGHDPTAHKVVLTA